MMKKVKWLVTVLVVASIALGIIGCSSPSGPSGSGNGGAQQGGANGGNHGEQPEVHEHTFAEEWSSDETNHWHASTCGHEVTVDKTPHTFGDWKTTKAATCTEEGSKTGVCKVCKKEVTEKIDVKGHTFGIWEITNEPTETEKGKMESVCKVCGETVTKELEPAPEGFRFVKGGTVVGAKNSNNYKGVFIEGRTVTLSDFYMGKYEVTQEEYASVMAGQKVTVNGTDYVLESNPSYCRKDSTSYTLFNGDVQEKRPVEGVTWYDAVWYCNALSKKEGLTPAYSIEVTSVYSKHIEAATVSLVPNADGYRLPTEAEWEYAARGGDPTKEEWKYMFSGADTVKDVSYSSSKNSGLDSVGWYCYNNITGVTGDSDVTNTKEGKGTHEVGKKKANRLGLYDMSGNVWERCWDRHYSISSSTAADGASSGDYRIFRGGSLCNNSDDCAVSYRGRYFPNRRDSALGFRVVRLAN